MNKVRVDKKQQGAAVKALMVFMNDLWLERDNHCDDIIYSVICDIFWTASRIAGRYNLKEYASLIALKNYIDTEYESENGKIED